MGVLEWIRGSGKPPTQTRAEQEAASKTAMVDHRWAKSGQYVLRALYPRDRFKLRMTLASMLGRELLGSIHDVMVLAATTEASAGDFGRIYQALRRYTASGNMPDRKVVQEAAGALWKNALRDMYRVMPDERVMNLDKFLVDIRPYLATLKPVLGAIEPDTMLEIADHMLTVRTPGGSGLYVCDVPCRDGAAIDALVPHDDLEAIIWWALLFNLHPSTGDGPSTSRSPDPQVQGPSQSGRTPSQTGRATGSSTSSGGRTSK